MKLIERIAEVVVDPFVRAWRMGVRGEWERAIENAKRELRTSASHEYVLEATRMMVVEEVQKALRPSEPIDLQKAHAGYVRAYGKHAQYGNPERPIAGVTTGRSYDYQSALQNQCAQRKGDQ